LVISQRGRRKKTRGLATLSWEEGNKPDQKWKRKLWLVGKGRADVMVQRDRQKKREGNGWTMTQGEGEWGTGGRKTAQALETKQS